MDNPDAIPLTKARSEEFHHITAKTLYLGKRGRPDLQLATVFLCTLGKAPDKHDYKKLSHEMKYLQATAHLPLILRADGKGSAIYIDGAHAVHADMKGHGGVFATLGSGSVYSASTKCKLNTISSTETELVVVGERLPKHIWFRYFSSNQSNNPTQIDTLYQDNTSTMLLENNGRLSCGKGSKHINIRYFFITDRIKQKEIQVKHCPTGEMIADYFTKPLQGSLFRKFRNMILGVDENNFDQYKQEYTEALKAFGLDEETKSSEPKECVGNQG